MKYHEMTKNYIFREFECGLTREQTAELCFKSVRTVSEWDKGKPIPPECKRLMRYARGREVWFTENWNGFSIQHNTLKLPTGQCVLPQQIILGIALIEIGSELETSTSNKILKYSRAISKIMGKS
ncbi:phage protein [Vibrio fluvialis]